jgi:hypothetical protein
MYLCYNIIRNAQEQMRVPTVTSQNMIWLSTYSHSHNITFDFSQLLNLHRFSDVRQIEIHTAEPLVPDPSPFEVEVAIAKLKKIYIAK